MLSCNVFYMSFISRHFISNTCFCFFMCVVHTLWTCHRHFQTSVDVASTRLDPSKVGWEGADRFFLVYEWKHAQFTYTEPLKPALNCMTCFESLLIETRTSKHCILLVWQSNKVRLHHVKRESLSTQIVALASYLLSGIIALCQTIHLSSKDQHWKQDAKRLSRDDRRYLKD